MKTIIIIIAILLLPVIRFYSVTPGDSDCMLDYIRSGQKTAYIYNFGLGKNHIDVKDLGEKNKTGKAEGCIMKSNNIVYDIFNTQYCYTSILLLKN